MTIIEKILEEHGPMLSGQLGELLQTQLSLSPEAARKQISRSLGKVKRKGGFFTNKQFFIYLQNQEYTEPYYDALIDALKTSARRLYVLVHALIVNKGFIKSQEFANYAFSPVKNLKGHKRFDAIVLDLIELGLIAHDSINTVYVLNKEIFDTKAIDPQKSKAIEVARNFIANQFMDWSRKIGLTSYHSGQTNGEFAKFQWAYTSPSYAGTITTGTKTGLQPGFIIADILIQSKAGVDDVSFFIEKVATLRALKGLPRYLPFLIIESATDDALQLLKKNGVVVGFNKYCNECRSNPKEKPRAIL